MYFPSEQINDVIPHDTTGLVNGDFTKQLFKDGAVSAVVVTVTEISNGNYSVSFTPDSSVGVTWSLRVYQTSRPNIFYTKDYRINADDAGKARKMLTNDLTRDAETGAVIILDDDGVTPIYEGTTDLSTFRTED